MRLRIAIFISLILIFLVLPALGQSNPNPNIRPQFLEQFKLRPPERLEAFDTPNDNGGSITLRWRYSPDDNLWGKRGLVEIYSVGRRSMGEKDFSYITTASFHITSAFDNATDDSTRYEYSVAAYPFKDVFKPIPWRTIVAADQVKMLGLLSPWMNVDPSGILAVFANRCYDYYRRLDGDKSDLVTKSIWENFSPGSKFSGPAGLAMVWLNGQLASPLGSIPNIFVFFSHNADPCQLFTLGKYLGRDMLTVSNMTGPVQSAKQWLNLFRVNGLVATLILCFLILFYIAQAKGGKELFIRKIAGLEAVDDAVGRATEMGKAIFYIPGTQDMDNVQTIAGVTILGRVAKLAAQYETKLEVPVSRSLVMVTSREIVKEAYMKAGRPDSFKEDMVYYLTDDQFGYAAAIDGKVVREKPAAMFFMGAFYAESLILVETGNSIGAIQIAGTAMPTQLPFFVAACDYTLIGEELFVASAYLSREPKLMGALKGQDIGKGLILIAMIVGIIIQSFGWFNFASLFEIAG